MIISLEIEQMIKELSNHDSDKARAYVNILNRVLLEMREQHKALKESMMLTSDSELGGLGLIRENIELRKEVDKLTGLLNEFNDEGNN